MSRRRAYKEETLAVMQRFFQTIDVLIEQNEIRGIQTYCRLYEIDKRHFYAQREDLGKGFFEVSWILPMISEYGVSANWLLFGKGQMFKPTRTK